MNDFDPPLEENPAIVRACYTFLAQVRAVVWVEGMSVVLLDQDRITSRVVFFWEPPHKRNGFGAANGGHGRGRAEADDPAVFISLKGREGALGAVLIRGRAAFNFGPIEPIPVGVLAEHLGAVVENILLQQRLDRSVLESESLDRISQIAGDDAPLEQVYDLFANELNNLVSFHRLTVFTANPEIDLLRCVHQVDFGEPMLPSERSLPISGSAYELAVSTGESCIFEDWQVGTEAGGTGFAEGNELRSALVVPVVYGGHTVGLVALENRLPNAYGSSDKNFLLRATALLGPAMSSSALCPQISEETVASGGVGVLMTVSEAVEGAGESGSHPWSNPLQRESWINVAHSLRTPLSSIKGYSSTLLQPDVAWPPEMYQEFIETIDREADELNRVINDLLGSVD